LVNALISQFFRTSINKVMFADKCALAQKLSHPLPLPGQAYDDSAMATQTIVWMLTAIC
jgi:hypothetical protein